jgi:hypothetical protein
MDSMMEETFKPDSVVEAVVKRFHDRAKFGKEKYGTDLDREDLTMEEWIQHAQDEAHDFILYLEKMKQIIQRFK